MTERPDFTKLNLVGLVNAYNELAKELREVHGQDRKELKTFHDKKTALVRCDALWTEVARAKGQPTSNPPASAEDQTAPTHQPSNDESVDETQQENTAMSDATQTDEAPAKRKRAPAKKTAKKAKAAPKKEATGARGRAPNFADNAKIKMVTRENPCREGTSAHEYFETAKASRTFGAYREAGGNLKYLYSFVERELVTIEG